MKRKTIITFIFIGAFLTQNLSAKNIAGLFLKAQDYKENKPSIELGNDTFKEELVLNSIFNSKFLYLKTPAKKLKLCKDSIWGYKDSKDNTYRFDKKDHREYKIVENKSVVLYTAIIPTYNNDCKKTQFEQKYFFSLTLTSEIMPLSVSNLIKTFPNNYILQSILTTTFNNSNSLIDYDELNKTYKINYIISKYSN